MKIAILGFGTVGSGTYESLKNNEYGIKVASILDRRELCVTDIKKVGSIEEIINDSEISLVVETMGGLHPAYEWVLYALNAGKHVVTANKQLVSFYYERLHDAANKNGVEFRYTASVGGGIPWIYNIRRQKRLDTITSVYGIVNGTTNFILDSMESADADFNEALAQAQRMGYAEADPSADIDGLDSKRKCAISASEAFSLFVDEKSVDTFGIRNIRRTDIEYCKNKGMKCRLIMTSFINKGFVRAYVEPIFILPAMLEYGVCDVYNLISMECKNAGRLSFYGKGAGRMPTGCAVANDIIDIASQIKAPSVITEPAIIDNSLEKHKYYLRVKSGTDVDLPTEIKYSEGDCDILITERVSVFQMHNTMNQVYKKDEMAFVASIGETV